MDIIFFIIGTLILYKIIELAVTKGINRSYVGIYFQEKVKNENQNQNKSFLENDLDQ